MANRYMYLVHKPTGKRINLGKRMGTGWYVQPLHYDENNPSLQEAMDKFYKEVDSGEPADLNPEQDDFEIKFTY